MGKTEHITRPLFQDVAVNLIAAKQGNAMLKAPPFNPHRVGSGLHAADFFGQPLVGEEAAIAFYRMIDEIAGQAE